MKKRWIIVALVAAIVGMACSFLSLQSYFNIQKNGSLFEESFCAFTPGFNCDIVEASSYSEIGGIPIAGLGMAYYFLILLFALYAKFWKGLKRPTVAFAWWTTLPANCYSFFLMYISGWVLDTFCITCIGMYTANIALFLSLFFAMKIPMNESWTFLWGYWASVFSRKKKGVEFMPRFFQHLLFAVLVFAVGFLIVSGATSAAMKSQITDLEVNDYVNRFLRQSKYDLKIDKENTAMWGTKDAPVTIVEFSDYRCPFCKFSAFMIKPFLAEYKDKVSYYFVNYPLDSECNHYMQNQMHPGACLGARGGICAEKGGKFWSYHDALFRTTGRITTKLVTDVAKKSGLNLEDFKTCINSASTERQLKSEIEVARKIYVTGTPSIFVNDRHLKFWRSPEILRSVVKKEIKKSKNESAKTVQK